MSRRTLVVVAMLWVVSLGVVAVTARAQPQPQPSPKVEVRQIPHPDILSGGDVGFRLDSWHGNTPVGTLVIRIDGKWVEPMTTKKHVLISR